MLPVGVQAKLSAVVRTSAVLDAILASNLYERRNFMESSLSNFVFGNAIKVSPAQSGHAGLLHFINIV